MNKKQKRYYYFFSYYFTNENNDNGYGYQTLNLVKKIGNGEDFLEVCNFIKNRNKLKEVVLLNYNLIGSSKIKDILYENEVSK